MSTKKRDYKDEYKKFQSSTKAKKYRAELNKYNRKKGTYGNGDGKDASHKGGKIVGFEAQSKNRGRREKSRLKKESTVFEDITKLEKLAMNLLRNINREAGVKKYDHTKTADFNKVVKFLKGKMPKVPNQRIGQIAMSYHDYRKKQPKIRIPDIDSVKDMEKTLKNLGMKEKPIRLKSKSGMGKISHLGMESVNERDNVGMAYKRTLAKVELKKIKDAIEMFQKRIKKQGSVTNARDEEHLKNLIKVYKEMGGKGIRESVTENKLVGMAIGIAKKMGGDMTGAIKKIEKISKGLSKQKAVKDALRQANESINEREMSIKDAFKDLVKDHGAKKALDMLADVLTGGALASMDDKKVKAFKKKLLKKVTTESANKVIEGLGDRISKISKKYSKGQKKSKKALKNKKGPYQEEMNETPYELGGMKVYSKADGLKKVKSMQKTDGAKIYKVTKTKTKLYDKYPVTMYNLHTKNKNHSTNSNPYGLDMMKGAYLIPIEEGTCGYGLDGNLGEEPAGPHLIKKKKKKGVTEKLDKTQASELLKQLGGNKFIMMTGAKNFTFGSNGLAFKIGRNAKAVNYVVIQLNGKDLYDMKFQKGTRVLKTANDVYADQLQKMFTKYTGMYTSLGTMGR